MNTKPSRIPGSCGFLAAGIFALCLACSTPLASPAAEAKVIAARTEIDPAGPTAGARVSVRVKVTGDLPVSRFGLTLRAASGQHDYWKTQTWEERLPPGAEAVLEVHVPFEKADEEYAEGSAFIESAWFE